jgi:hypothetical protein
MAIKRIIIIAEESLRTPVATLRNVVGKIRDHNARETGHQP